MTLLMAKVASKGVKITQAPSQNEWITKTNLFAKHGENIL